MAISGYDTRPAGRESFAFNGAPPVQDRPVSSGNSRGAQVVGGNSAGGVVTASQQTDPGPVGGTLGAYFENLMQPYIQRKQEQRFAEGYTAAQSGIALKELSHPNSAVTKIFGPTGYEQGAQFYTAQAAVSKWQNDQLDNLDKLKLMTDTDLAAHVAKSSTDILTGDQFADQFIQKGLMTAMAPVLNTVHKARVEWQQNLAISSQHTAVVSAGTAMQRIISDQTHFGQQDPSAEGQTAIRQSQSDFVGLLAKPEGMTDDSYRSMLYGTARDAMQTGNGYAVAAMKSSGYWDLIPPDQQDKLDDQYIKYGTRANSLAQSQFTGELIQHDAKVAAGTMTPTEAAQDLATINEKIKRSTGFDVDVFDAGAVRGEAHTVTMAALAAWNKADDRAYERAQRDEDRAYKRQEKDREDYAAALTAVTTWQSGNPIQAIMARPEVKDLIEAQASNDWVTGNLSNIVRNFNSGYVSPAVTAAAKSGVEASVGEQYDKNFAREYTRWDALYKAKPAAALAYYGSQYHNMMQRFDALTKAGHDPSVAFSKTFGDPFQYGTADVGPDRRKEITKSLPGIIKDQASWNNSSHQNLGTLGNNVIQQVVLQHVEMAGNNSPVPTTTLGSEAVGAAIANGSLERYGQFAWRNKAGTQPLSQLLGLRDRDTTAVWNNVYNRHMKMIGASAFTDPTALVRVDNNGHPAMVGEVDTGDGSFKRFAITYEELAKEAHAYVDGRVAYAKEHKPTDPTMRPGFSSAMR